MAGGTRQGDRSWLNVSQGQLVNRKDNIALDFWQGHIISVEKRAGEYNGEPKIDVWLGMEDRKTGEKVMISFNAESPFARGFFSRIKNVDLSQQLVLGVLGWNDDGKRDKAVSLCYISQFDKKIEKDEAFPNGTKIKAAGKTLTDWTPMNEATDEVMTWMERHIGSFGGLGHEDAPFAVQPDGSQAPPPEKEDTLPF